MNKIRKIVQLLRTRLLHWRKNRIAIKRSSEIKNMVCVDPVYTSTIDDSHARQAFLLPRTACLATPSEIKTYTGMQKSPINKPKKDRQRWRLSIE